MPGQGIEVPQLATTTADRRQLPTPEAHCRATPGGWCGGYFPIQKVEKMRFSISSAVVAPVIASIGRNEL